MPSRSLLFCPTFPIPYNVVPLPLYLLYPSSFHYCPQRYLAIESQSPLGSLDHLSRSMLAVPCCQFVAVLSMLRHARRCAGSRERQAFHRPVLFPPYKDRAARARARCEQHSRRRRLVIPYTPPPQPPLRQPQRHPRRPTDLEQVTQVEAVAAAATDGAGQG